jgi:hypothetical protein
MSDLFDEIFGENRDDRKICSVIATMEMLRDFEEKGIDVLDISINLGLGKVSTHVKARKGIFEDLGLEEDVIKLSDEIRPILAKYTHIIAEKQKHLIEDDPEKMAELTSRWITRENKHNA